MCLGGFAETSPSANHDTNLGLRLLKPPVVGLAVDLGGDQGEGLGAEALAYRLAELGAAFDIDAMSTERTRHGGRF